jgi:hypothetical protein
MWPRFEDIHSKSDRSLVSGVDASSTISALSFSFMHGNQIRFLEYVWVDGDGLR